MKQTLKKIALFIVILISSFALVSCGKKEEEKPPQKDDNNDYLVEEFEPIELEVGALEIDEIPISTIEEQIINSNPTKIENISIEVVAINDETLSLAKSELNQFYGLDLDVEKLWKDLTKTAAIFVVYVAVTAAAALTAPTTGGASLGAGKIFLTAIIKVAKTVADVTTKASAIISAIGVAVDGAIEGLKAYQEGGDISYILGKSLNGIVDGIKWSVLFYPFSVGVEKLVSAVANKKLIAKATKYIDDISRVVSKDAGEGAAKRIFAESMKNADEILNVINKVNNTADVGNDVYQALAKLVTNSTENTVDVGKIIFKMFTEDKMDLFKLLKQFNPYDNIARVTKNLQQNFLDVTGESFEQIRKGLVQGTISSLDDELIRPFKNTIIDNLDDFQLLFGNIISDTLKKDILSETAQKLGKISSTTSKEIVETLFSQLKKDGNLYTALDQLIKNSDGNIKTIELIRNLLKDPGVNGILTSSTTSKKMVLFSNQLAVLDNLNIYAQVKDEAMVKVLGEILNGNYDDIGKVLADLGHPNALASKIIQIDYLSLKKTLESLPGNQNYDNLLRSIANVHLKKNNIPDEMLNTVLSSSKYSDEVIEKLADNSLGKESLVLIFIRDFSTSDNLDKVLDSCCKNFNLSDEMIKQIKTGVNVLDIFNEDQYATTIRLYNALYAANEKLGSEYTDNFIKSFNEIALRYFDNVINDNDLVRNKIVSQLLNDLEYDSTEFLLERLKVNLSSEFDEALYKEIENIYNIAKIIAADRNTSGKYIEPDKLAILFDKLFNGQVHSLDDLNSFLDENTIKIIKSNFSYGEALIYRIKQSAISNTEGLIKNIQILSIAGKLNNNVAGHNMTSVVNDVITNSLSKEDIINKFGYQVYYNFVEHANLISSKLMANANDEIASLTRNLAIDYITKNIDEGTTNLTKEILEEIISGKKLDEITGITKEMIVDNYSSLFNYAKAIKSKDLLQELIEGRTSFFAGLGINEANINGEFAGKAFITKSYGEIYFSVNGFPIFDEYAIASITMKLTGNSSEDIARANLQFFGNSVGPAGFTWHHVEDGRTLILIPTDLHKEVKHTGGAHYLRNYLDILFNGGR